MTHSGEQPPAGTPQKEASETPLFMQRLATLPLMERMASLYDAHARHSSSEYVKRTVGAMESSLAIALSTTQPLLDRHADKLKSVDSLACASFDRVEGTARHVMSNISNMRNQVHSSREAVSSAATSYADNVLRSFETTVCAASNSVLGRADRLVDVALPPADTEKKTSNGTAHPGPATYADMAAKPASETDAALGAESRRLIDNARAFSSKVQMRAYTQALNQLQFARTRTGAVVDQFRPYTVDLLSYARDHLDALADASDEETDSDAAAAAQNTTEMVPSVAGSEAVGTALSRVERSRRRAVRRAARYLRSALDQPGAWAAWAMQTLQHSPALAAEIVHQARVSAQNVRDTASATIRHPLAATSDAAVATYQAAAGFGNEALTQARKNRLVQMGEKRATAVLKNPTVAAMQHQAEQLVLAMYHEAQARGLLPASKEPTNTATEQETETEEAPSPNLYSHPAVVPAVVVANVLEQ